MPKSSNTLVFDATGTKWLIHFFQEHSQQEVDHISVLIRSRVELFEQTYSRFRPDSLVTDVSKAAGNYRFPDDAQPMFSLYRELYELTQGAFTPLIGQVLVDAGYDPQYSLQTKTLKSPPAWEDVLDIQSCTLHSKRPVQLDFGAVGKGYVIDLVASILLKQGIQSFSIDAGGDILHHGSKNNALRVGLEHPNNPEQVIGIVEIVNRSIAGSSGRRRAWGDFHHVIDPFSLSSPRHILACWVIADTTMLADALATCLFLCPKEKLKMKYVFEYLILYPDYSIEKSPGFKAEIFTS